MQLENFISKYITKRPKSLLHDDFIKYHDELEERINGKKVLVIGGAGTIGSFYIKALLRFEVKSLVVVDISENGLTELVRDLRSSSGYNIPDKFITYPVDFGTPVFEKIFREHGPFDIVANFAAHKHVRSEKDAFSIEAMIENNVLKAKGLLELLLDNPPEHFFCVSTDKAAAPVNIMGASKKLMEELIMAYSDQIKITTARFANVAFSNGSLPAGWLERLNKNQPWPCPLGIKRFFVSPTESGELCLMASVMGESGDIIYPRLDPEKDMIPFDQIARDLANYLGLELIDCTTEEEAIHSVRKGLVPFRDGNGTKPIPFRDGNGTKPIPFRDGNGTKPIPFRDGNGSSHDGTQPIFFFRSDTSGEKPYEEFYTENEVRDEQRFIKLGAVKNTRKKSREEIDEIINRLEQRFKSGHIKKEEIIEILKQYIPGFKHIETGKNLDGKM